MLCCSIACPLLLYVSRVPPLAPGYADSPLVAGAIFVVDCDECYYTWPPTDVMRAMAFLQAVTGSKGTYSGEHCNGFHFNTMIRHKIHQFTCFVV